MSKGMGKGRWLAKVPLLGFGVVLSSASPVAAQPIPKVGTCPSGYHASGGYCAPSATAGPALPKPASARPATTRAAAIVLARETLATPCTGSAHARWAIM